MTFTAPALKTCVKYIASPKRAFPASAAGPDLRQVVLGSEGRLGILTHVTVRASRLPETDDVVAAFLPDGKPVSRSCRNSRAMPRGCPCCA